jgi:uncharacterized protein with PIN domain
MQSDALKFIADVHLGKLARCLRLLGFDTRYQNNSTKDDLLRFALEENRIVLSRDFRFGKNRSINFILVEHEDPAQQLSSLVQKLHLEQKLHPFSICLACNGKLERRDKEKIASLLEDNTRKFFNEFWQCSDCHRVYWKGSHYHKMLKLVQTIERMNNETS